MNKKNIASKANKLNPNPKNPIKNPNNDPNDPDNDNDNYSQSHKNPYQIDNSPLND